ncbi:hypothetical protein [Salinispora tropica]|uniref:hypothetical protein n=1 Tax=Salinispora tropica TaxID=168695 RepID=UPI0012BD5797|nr:hypothetical protein [Salinispora tropica]
MDGLDTPVSGKFWADTQRLKTSSSGYNRLADHLAAALESYQSRASEIGNCWGEDEMGRAFGQTYEAGSADLERALGDLVEIAAKIGENVAGMAQTFEAADVAAQDAVDVFENASENVGSGFDSRPGGGRRS